MFCCMWFLLDNVLWISMVPRKKPYLNSLSIIQGVPLATEPGISLIILTPMKILQWNLNRSTFFSFTFLTQWEVHFKFHCNILISGKIIKEMPGSVASGTHCVWSVSTSCHVVCILCTVKTSWIQSAWDQTFGFKLCDYDLFNICVCTVMWAQDRDRDRWQALVSGVMEFGFHKMQNFMTSWDPVSFSRKTLLHGVSTIMCLIGLWFVCTCIFLPVN
jgi:hypothetical protein